MINVLHVLTSPATAAVHLLPLLADAAIKGLVVFGVALCAVTLCRRRSAATRHAIWAGAVAAQLALPGLSALLPAWRVPLVDRLDTRFRPASSTDMPTPPTYAFTYTPSTPEPPTIAITSGRMRHSGRFGVNASRGAWRTSVGISEGEAYVVRPAQRFRFSSAVRALQNRGSAWWLRAAAVVWLLGAIGIFGRFIAGTLAVSRLARRSERVDDGRWLSLGQRIAKRLGVARPMTLLRSARFDVPVTWGIVYPVVLLPDDADDWSDERRRYVLVHEMAHVKRVDAFTQLIAQVAIATFWFNPFVWIAAYRMRVEREHACDDYVLREGTPASTYAADLLAMVRSVGTRRRSAQPAFAALAMARPGELASRMQAILDPAQDRRSLRSAPALGMALCSLLLLVPLAAFRPFADQAPKSCCRKTWAPAITITAPTIEEGPLPAAAPIPRIESVPPEVWADLKARVQEAQAAIEATATARAVAAAAAMASTEATNATAANEPIVATTATSSWSTSSGSSCSSVSLRRSGRSTSVHTSSDDDDSSFQYISSSAGRCVQVAVWGHVEFSPDEREIRSVSPDGRFYMRERRPNSDRELEVTAGDENAPHYSFSVNGERAAFDDDARSWLEELLPEVLRESGLNARAHVARVRRDGGIDAVLADISRIESTSAKRAAYEALLRQGGFSEEDAAKIARKAGEDLSSSDGELRAVLAQMGTMGHGSSRMAEAFSSAVEHMSSDGEKRALLQQYALNGDRDMLRVSMRQAKSIASDGEKAEFLRATVGRYLGNDDESLRRAFFDVTQTISSDGEKRAVLNEALQFAQRPDVLLSVLDIGRQISSDGEKSELLVTIVRRKLLTSPPLRDAFMRTTRSLSSDAEYRRVMEATLEVAGRG